LEGDRWIKNEPLKKLYGISAVIVSGPLLRPVRHSSKENTGKPPGDT
jgi:hypothetical protein